MDNWHAVSVEDIKKELKTDDGGLSSDAAKKRLDEQGPNTITKNKGTRWYKVLFDQFINPLSLLLIFAGTLSLFLKEGLESIAIFTIILINALLGFIQEFRAGKSIEALAKLSARTATVRRDGKEHRIDASELVAGDVIILDAGDVVAADARLFDASNLKIEESGLTGESVAVEKATDLIKEKAGISEKKNLVFMGTTVTQGHGEAIVVSTGMATEFGQIAKSLDDVKESTTPLQKKFEQLAKQIGFVAMGLIALVFAISLLRGGSTFAEILLFALVLAVGTIPSALPLVVTLGLSFGARRLAKNKMLIRHLSAAESLGSATFICTDKTGTLTKNQMTVTRLYAGKKLSEVSGRGYDPKGSISDDVSKQDSTRCARIASLCNDAKLAKKGDGYEVIGDPMEASLLVLAQKAGLKKTGLRRIKDFPFDSERKLMSVVVEEKRKKEVFVKGAPEILLKKCTKMLVSGKARMLSQKERAEILKQQKAFAENALRVLALAYKPVQKSPSKADEAERGLVFAGLVGMLDPAREGVKEAIVECRSAGIGVMMITGDHETTARAIAKEVGLLDSDGLVLTSEQLDKMSEKELVKKVESIRVVSRAYPLQKLKIIEALQKRKHVVAMTGDGVNDAPALKRADIGISMGQSGTEVAKEASKAVLVDDHFATIVSAIKEGRNIYDKIIKSAKFLLGCNLGEITTILISLVLGLPLPLLALQILMINMLTDTAPATGLGLEKPEEDVMKRKPRDPQAPPVNGRLFASIVVFGVLLGVSTIYLFTRFLPRGLEEARTVAFTTLVFMQLFNVLSARKFKTQLNKLNVFTNPYLLGGIALSVLLHLSVVYIPLFQPVFGTVALDAVEFVFILGLCVGSYIIIEIFNLALFNLRKSSAE